MGFFFSCSFSQETIEDHVCWSAYEIFEGIVDRILLLTHTEGEVWKGQQCPRPQGRQRWQW